jgi:uncharacterized RDD family membrane protein YckC
VIVEQGPGGHAVTVEQGPGGSTVRAAGPPSQGYVGLVTRTIAFVLDAAIINVVATIVGVGASLILSIVHVTGDAEKVCVAVGAFAYVAWSVGYFVAFWSTTGQTPGNRVMGFRVLGANGELIRPGRAIVRWCGLLLAALPLFAGYLMILFDSQRRGLQDRIAHTVVVEAPIDSRLSARLARGSLVTADIRLSEVEAGGGRDEADPPVPEAPIISPAPGQVGAAPGQLATD